MRNNLSNDNTLSQKFEQKIYSFSTIVVFFFLHIQCWQFKVFVQILMEMLNSLASWQYFGGHRKKIQYKSHYLLPASKNHFCQSITPRSHGVKSNSRLMIGIASQL